MGLDKNLDEVRGRVLGSKPLPNIRAAFSEVRQEESQKKVVMVYEESTPTLDTTTLAAQGTQPANGENRQKKGRPWGDHCLWPGHARKNC